mmetsp:Transcript_7514/g.16576  ORF Transcript_7514/g.16576 Transcript_7514/m.16576 type:complete len:461 (-) Transcript_7514:1300-2682(-)
MVLVLGLALAEHDVAGQLHAVDLLHRLLGAMEGPLDQHRVVAHLLAECGGAVEPLGAIDVRGLVDVRDAQVGEALEEKVGVGSFLFAGALHRAVELARDHVAELLAHQVLEGVAREPFPLRLQPQRALVVHHAVDGARERLPTERGPQAQLHQKVAVLEEFGLVTDVDALEEVLPLVRMDRLEKVEDRDAVLVLRRELARRVEKVLGAEGREGRPRLGLAHGRRARHVHEERADKPGQPTVHLNMCRLRVELRGGAEQHEAAQLVAPLRLQQQPLQLLARVALVPEEAAHRELERLDVGRHLRGGAAEDGLEVVDDGAQLVSDDADVGLGGEGLLAVGRRLEARVHHLLGERRHRARELMQVCRHENVEQLAVRERAQRLGRDLEQQLVVAHAEQGLEQPAAQLKKLDHGLAHRRVGDDGALHLPLERAALLERLVPRLLADRAHKVEGLCELARGAKGR